MQNPLAEFEIRQLTDSQEKSRACAEIIGELPDWFGQVASNKKFIREIANKDCFAGVIGDGILGLIALDYHFNTNAEVWWLGIKPSFHRHGLGRQLMNAAERRARERRCQNLVLTTLSERSDDAFYMATRAFYFSVGFRPFVEFNQSDPQNPMMWMVKSL